MALLASGVVLAPQGETSQVVIRLGENGPVELPVFHAAGGQSTMDLGVEYKADDRDHADQEIVAKCQYLTKATTRNGRQNTRSKYRAPRRLTVQTRINVPSPELYRIGIGKLLRTVIDGSDLFDKSAVPDLTIEFSHQTLVSSRFVREANCRL